MANLNKPIKEESMKYTLVRRVTFSYEGGGRFSEYSKRS